MTLAIELVRRLTWKRGTRWNKEISKVAIGSTRRASSRSIIFCSQYYPQIWLCIMCTYINSMHKQFYGSYRQVYVARLTFLSFENARESSFPWPKECASMRLKSRSFLYYQLLVCIVNMHTMLSHSTRVYYNPRKIDVSRQLLRVCILLASSMHIYAFHAYYTSSTTSQYAYSLSLSVVLYILLVRVVNYNSRAMYYYSTTLVCCIRSYSYYRARVLEYEYWSMNTPTRVASILQ